MLDWVAKIQYEELKPVYAGTVFLEADAKHNEIETAVYKMFDQHLPKGYKIVELIRGSIWFVPAKENK